MRLFGHPVALAAIARCTGGNHVFPNGGAAPGAWDNVIDCEFVLARLSPAVLASVHIARHDGAARKRQGQPARNGNEGDQPDDQRPVDCQSLGADLALQRFPFWHDRKFGMQALVSEGRMDEALAYAEASRGLNQPDAAIDAAIEPADLQVVAELLPVV